MVTKSRLRMAIAAEKGVDFKRLKQAKKEKVALKRKRALGVSQSSPAAADGQDATAQATEEEAQDEGADEGWSDEETDEEELNLDAVDDSDTSESSIELEEKSTRKLTQSRRKPAADEEEDEDEEDDEDIPISDLEDLDDEDKEELIPHTRLTINNTAALRAALDRISIPTDSTASFASHQSVVASVATADSIPDVSDDLQRELAFYSQCLEAVRHGRAKLLAEGVPFSRPKDYFAEMVKEDAHMEKVKAKLVEEASAKKAAAEARKLRDLKKFGKQVQVAKLQERHKAKRETLDKIKTLKRKRKESGADSGTTEADMFDVGVDDEIAKHSQRGPKFKSARPDAANGPNSKRLKKNDKYGFGGKKRHAKSGDAVSSGDLSSFDAKRMKAAGARGRGKGGKSAPRPGKARRKAIATR